MLLFFLTPWMLLKIFTSPLLPILKSARRGEGHEYSRISTEDAKLAAIMSYR